MFCNNCGEKIPEGTTKCPKCGEFIVSKANLEQITKNSAQAAATGVAAENFAEVMMGDGCLGLLLLFFNPLYWTGRGYLERAQEAAKDGDIDLSNAMLKKGKRYIWLAFPTSILLIALVIAVAVCCIKYRSSTATAYRVGNKPAAAQMAGKAPMVEKVEEEGPKATTSRSIRGEMRHGALGGYVLQLWNTTDQPLECEAVLNNPKLKQSPKYLFVLQPKASKPQELGAVQFGHRILTKPPCTVTVTVLATGETHTYRP